MSVPALSADTDPRQLLTEAVDHLGHVLPDQAPILNFVHHNTLHGYQHLPFEQALLEAERVTSIHCYQPEADFRRYYAQGRIDDSDIDAALTARSELQADEIALTLGERSISRREVLRAALVRGAEAIGSARLAWLQRNGGIAPLDLWRACLDALGIETQDWHPEDLLDLSDTLAQSLAPASADSGVQRQMREYAQAELAGRLAAVGAGESLRDVFLSLMGEDLLEQVRPLLIRYLGAYLDEGLSAWALPGRREGFYAAWRRLAAADAAPAWADAAQWRADLAALPEASADSVAWLLTEFGIPPSHWPAYLQRIALELPGWSGMVSWRQQRAGYAANRDTPASLMDYLAVRLFLDRQWLSRRSRESWRIPANLAALEGYFTRYRAEWLVRSALRRADLPEYLADAAQRLLAQGASERDARQPWQNLADKVWTWLRMAELSAGQPTAHGDGWRLFRLTQHLGLDALAVRTLGRAGAQTLLRTLDSLTPHTRGILWLSAYERHYRETIFSALVANHGRGPWAKRERRPEAQVIFCMDDREEGIRRHLEELNPDTETLGAAGFFGVPINWRGLDDVDVTPLCPIVVVPSNEVREIPQPGCEAAKASHDRRRGWRALWDRLLHQELRRNLLSSSLATAALAPAMLPALVGKTVLPRHTGALAERLRRRLAPEVPSRLLLTALDDGTRATPDQPRLGFTDSEQADRVAAFLRTVGLTYGFAKLVVLSGHGSISQNNPHLAAYDCGACSGRHGGPNARVFAAMANRPEVRKILEERGIAIPSDTWFIGTEHNTADETILWYDLDLMPPAFGPALAKLKAELEEARRLSAHERCRRVASAPRNPSPKQALQHMSGRTLDFSQIRPELGHATNATAFIGRRSLSRGAFFDRRAFLISYDPTQDAEGRILENILLAAGPVGAGINLEYYFSTVSKDGFGCGSKVPHNVTGLFAVMEGTASDLRTGLPRQMTEIHEAMRLLVVTEHQPDVVAAIYARQPALRELIGNAWLQLATLDPETGRIWHFDAATESFLEWQGRPKLLPRVKRSRDWYAGHSAPLPPALIERSAIGGALSVPSPSGRRGERRP